MAQTLLFFFLLLLLSLQVFTLNTNTCNAGDFPTFTTVLIFGDSTVDTGNNNYIKSIWRSNHPPYGSNFPGHLATGRFSDGKLVPDYLATFLGIKDTVPPFLDPNLSDFDLITGVSFASAGSGFDDLTSVPTGAIPVSKQSDYFRSYMKRLKSTLGEEAAQNITNGAMVIISAGTNDFLIDYYDLGTRKFHFTMDRYQDFVLNNLQYFVKELYSMGCRWMVVAGLPPMGCLPLQMTVKFRLRTCLKSENSDAVSYNLKLASLLPQLESALPGSKLFYADVYTPVSDMINNPQKYGFAETRRGCCGTGLLEAGPLCSPFSAICANASEFLFFDGIHPSGSAYEYISQALVEQIIGQILNGQ